MKYVIFKLDNEQYGMDVLKLNAVERCIDIFSVPNAPMFIKGIINLRGDIIPVYSLRKKFNLKDRECDSETRLMIAQTGDSLVAFEVDMVTEIFEIEDEWLSDPPGLIYSIDTEYIDKVAQIDNKIIITLNIESILSKSDKESISKIHVKKAEDDEDSED